MMNEHTFELCYFLRATPSAPRKIRSEQKVALDQCMKTKMNYNFRTFVSVKISVLYVVQFRPSVKKYSNPSLWSVYLWGKK